MDEAQKMVREFHKEFDIHVAESPSVPDTKTTALRERLIQEEFDELKEAMKARESSRHCERTRRSSLRRVRHGRLLWDRHGTGVPGSAAFKHEQGGRV